MPPLLHVDDLRTYFFTRDGVVRAVDGVSFVVERGQVLGVVGESGSGKSVTGLSIMRLVPEPPGKVMGGDIRFKGRSILAMSDREQRELRGNRIAMIFQDPMTALNPVHRLGRQIAEPLRVHRQMDRKDAWAAAVELLSQVGIPRAAERACNYPHEFSGGMRQRAMIAMALACGPDVLIADEPTTALDVTVQAQILDLLRRIQRDTKSAMILITHDLGVIADLADRVLVMYAGRPVEYGPVDRVFYNPLHPYTRGLLESLPRRDVDGRGALRPIKGQPPSLIDLPRGCAFGPRCSCRISDCLNDCGGLAEIEPDHFSSCRFAGEADFAGRFANSVPLTDPAPGRGAR